MSQPFFSVIIPVFNRAPMLETAIRSVLDQTCQDFEIVVVDDGSKDDPGSVVARLGDPRITFIRQENAGGGAARNRAIDAARGLYIAPLDSDDIFLPHHLAAMKTLLDGTRGLAGYARIKVDRGEGREFLKPPRAIREDEDMGEYLLCDRGFVPTITLAVSRDVARSVRYPEKLRAAEDTDFAIRLALAGVTFKMLEEPGAVWKDLADPNRTSASARGKRLAAWLEAMQPHLTHRAWLGARGWAFAKMVAREGRKFEALKLYLRAVLAGCYRPSLALIVLLQVMLDAGAYRAIANSAIGWLHMGLRERDLPAKAQTARQA